MRRSDREALVEIRDIADADVLVDWERFHVVTQALHQLGGPCQQLLTLMFLDPSQPSNAEIARRLGRALGGIGPMRGRCLEKLRVLIEEEAPW